MFLHVPFSLSLSHIHKHTLSLLCALVGPICMREAQCTVRPTTVQVYCTTVIVHYFALDYEIEPIVRIEHIYGQCILVLLLFKLMSITKI